MSGLALTITDAGRAALVNAANTGTTPVMMTEVGVSATAVNPTPDATALPGEIKRLTTFAGDVVAADTIHVTVRDESSDTYTVRALGLYLEDGTLFALYGQLEPIMEKSAQAMLLLAIDVAFADIDATQITFGNTDFLNPPATTERQGVVELATDAETTSGSDAARVVTPKGLKAAVSGWLDSRFGDGAPSAFVKSLLTKAGQSDFQNGLGLKSAALEEAGTFAQATHSHNAGDIDTGTLDNLRLAQGAVPQRSIPIAASTDLNELTALAAGFYHIPNNATAATIANLPTPHAGSVLIQKWDNDYSTQLYVSYGGISAVYARAFADGSWSPWRKMADDLELQAGLATKADVSDFARLLLQTGWQKFRGGGTLMWGRVTVGAGATVTVALPDTMPAQTCTVVATPNNAAVNLYISNITTSNFQVHNPGSTSVVCTYVAIGF